MLDKLQVLVKYYMLCIYMCVITYTCTDSHSCMYNVYSHLLWICKLLHWKQFNTFCKFYSLD